MTLIAFTTLGDTAQILTDSISYSGSGRHTGQSSKVQHLHHIDTAVATQGNSEFGNLAFAYLGDHGWQANDVDELLVMAPEILQSVWAALSLSTPETDGAVFVIGWSPREGEFVSYVLDAATDFEAVKLEGTFAMPAPWSFRPSDLELARFEQSKVVDDESLQNWIKQPVIPAPTSRDGWLALGVTAYSDRSLHHKASRVWIGGGLFLTQVARGAHLTEKIYEFDSSGEQFAAAVAGTLHPQAQIAPCICGSDKAFMDCCLPLDEPCRQHGDGKPIRDCCVLTPAEREALETP